MNVILLMCIASPTIVLLLILKEILLELKEK